MPVTWQKKSKEYSIVVWHSKEPVDVLKQNAYLSPDEEKDWTAFKSETRKREFLTVRNALQILLPGNIKSTISYDANGKPHLEKFFVSISHSNDFIALMISEKPGIGIDIEEIHPRILKLSSKFLSTEEIKMIHPGDPLEKIHVMWGAKEVLYKIHSIGGIDFRKDLYVDPFDYSDNGEIKASIKKYGSNESFNIHFEKLDNFMLTWSYRDLTHSKELK